MKKACPSLNDLKKSKNGDSGGTGQKAGIGVGDHQYNFHVNDLINHAKSYPTQSLSVKPLHQKATQMREGGAGETSDGRKKRMASADLKYPIIATNHPTEGLMVLDGTHRLERAHGEGHQNIDAHVIPWNDMDRYKAPTAPTPPKAPTDANTGTKYQGVKSKNMLGKSLNDMKKNEDLEKTGTMTKLALAAALAGPIVTHQKGTLFDDTETPITRSIAGEPAHEKEDDSGKHEAIKHVIGQKPYTITHVTSEAKAPAMKEKFKSIRNQIKGNE